MKTFEKQNSVWDSPLFHDVQIQFEQIAQKISLDENIFHRLRVPDRALIVSVPFRMDDGSVRVVPGYRVQHNDVLGPCKGGIRSWLVSLVLRILSTGLVRVTT